MAFLKSMSLVLVITLTAGFYAFAGPISSGGDESGRAEYECFSPENQDITYQILMTYHDNKQFVDFMSYQGQDLVMRASVPTRSRVNNKVDAYQIDYVTARGTLIMSVLPNEGKGILHKGLKGTPIEKLKNIVLNCSQKNNLE